MKLKRHLTMAFFKTLLQPTSWNFKRRMYNAKPPHLDANPHLTVMHHVFMNKVPATE